MKRLLLSVLLFGFTLPANADVFLSANASPPIPLEFALGAFFANLPSWLEERYPGPKYHLAASAYCNEVTRSQGTVHVSCVSGLRIAEMMTDNAGHFWERVYLEGPGSQEASGWALDKGSSLDQAVKNTLIQSIINLSKQLEIGRVEGSLPK